MSHSEERIQLWGGRFASGPSPELAKLSKSTHFDFRLADQDIAGSQAHAQALHDAGLLTAAELEALHKALIELKAQVADGRFVASEADEDVHTALERGLLEIAGEVGGKLRAGRSRNDQIATLTRRYLREQAKLLGFELYRLAQAIIHQAQAHPSAVMPGRTHLQHAQPVLLAHHLLAHVWPIIRNLDRLRDWDERADESPYGSGALAGASLGLDAQQIGQTLGFKKVAWNSIDATSARDIVAEFSFICALVAIDLSRFSEEIIIWNTKEFDFITLDDAYSTGSSIMPQKKNPDIAELARGKAGRIIGDLTGLLSTFKALPLAYNRDLQEDKEPVFDQIDNLLVLLPAFTGMVATAQFNIERMALLAPQGFSLATDIAEWLVKQGVAFRSAHEVAGQCVRLCEEQGIELHELSLDQLSQLSSAFNPEIYDVLTVQGSIASRDGISGTAPSSVAKQLAEVIEQLSQVEVWVTSKIR